MYYNPAPVYQTQDYCSIETETEYYPRKTYEKYIEYVPVERIVEKIEFDEVKKTYLNVPQDEYIIEKVPKIVNNRNQINNNLPTYSNPRTVAVSNVPLTNYYIPWTPFYGLGGGVIVSPQTFIARR